MSGSQLQSHPQCGNNHAHVMVEVRDSRTGYLLPARDGPGALPDGQSSWDAVVAVVAVSWKMYKI